MSRETEVFLKYIYNGIKVYSDDDEKILQSARNPQLVDFEAKDQKVNGPDFLFDIGDIVFAVEHFEYDATKFIKRKGNQNRQEIARVERDFKLYIDANSQESQHNKHDELKCDFDVSYLIDNFKRSFDKHYKNIEDYISNIINCGKEIRRDDIRMAFFIEDTTPLGSYYLDEEGMPVPFSIFQVKEFKEFLTGAVGVDYFFNGITCFSSNEMFLVSRENIDCEKIKQLHEIDFSKTKYFTFDTPKVMSFQVQVPEEDIDRI